MPRINYGMSAIGAALPALEDAAYQQESLSQALQQQKMAAAQRQLDFDQAVTIFKVKDSQVVRQLEQQRIDQHERAQGIAWRNQIAAMGGRALPQGQQAGPDDIVQVDPFTGDQFAYKSPDAVKRDQMTRLEENDYRKIGYVVADADAPADAATVTLGDGRKMYKPLVSYDLTKGAGIASYFGDRLKAFQDDQANLETWADKEYTAKLAQYKAYAATAKGDAKTTVEAQIAAMESAKAETLERFKKEEKDRLGRAFVFWQARYDKPVNFKDVPPEFMPPGFQDGGQSVQESPAAEVPQSPGEVRTLNSGATSKIDPATGAHIIQIKGVTVAIIPPANAKVTTDILDRILVQPDYAVLVTENKVQQMVQLQILTPVQLANMTPEMQIDYAEAIADMVLLPGAAQAQGEEAYKQILATYGKAQ